MDEKTKQTIELRKLQESTANLINGEFHKEIAKWQKALYDAYVEQGFNEVQALELLKSYFNANDRR